MSKQKANYKGKHLRGRGGRTTVVGGRGQRENRAVSREMSDTDKMTSQVIWALIGIAALWVVFA